MTTQVSTAGLESFQNIRFGMFIHWGLYSILGRGEWVMHNEHIAVEAYDKLVSQFNPTKFNADEWVSIAADAGQKYIVITSRHHDGFSMYDTAFSDYKVTNSPFRRDPLQELANACARRGDLKMGFYTSFLDWHHPAYRFRETNGLAWSDYMNFLFGQIRELCTNFGEIACLWIDGDWTGHSFPQGMEYFAPGGPWEHDKLYDMIHTLQPHAVLLNNHHGKPFPGEDIQGFEQFLPGTDTTGFNTTTVYPMPLEVNMTMNDSWGWNRTDQNHKSTRHLVHNLVRSASAGANYLLNVGPTPDGEILPVHAERLREIGLWLKIHGASIYGTRAGAILSTANVVSTRHAATHYVHVMDYMSDSVRLDAVPDTLTRAKLLRDGTPIRIERHNGKTVLMLSDRNFDLFDTAIELT